MGVVRGDRIGDSRKLSACTPEQQDAYARLVATLPDDFGRFRLSLTQIVAAMYPRLEDSRRIARAASRWGRFLEVFEGSELIRIWEADGARFGELSSWEPRKNPVWHRTPEPPWGGHAHTGWCLSTAVTRSREFGSRQETEALTLQLKELRERNASGRVGGKGGYPSPPSPPSPPRDQKRTTDPGPASPEPAPPALALALVPARPKARKAVDPWPTSEAIDDWRERYGAGSGKPGQIVGALTPLVRGQAGGAGPSSEAWSRFVRPAWRRYLGLGPGQGTTHPAPSAQDFAGHFGDWLPGGRGASNGGAHTRGQAPTLEENQAAAVELRRMMEAHAHGKP